MSTEIQTDRHTDLVPEVAPSEVGHLKIWIDDKSVRIRSGENIWMREHDY